MQIRFSDFCLLSLRNNRVQLAPSEIFLNEFRPQPFRFSFFYASQSKATCVFLANQFSDTFLVFLLQRKILQPAVFFGYEDLWHVCFRSTSPPNTVDEYLTDSYPHSVMQIFQLNRLRSLGLMALRQRSRTMCDAPRLHDFSLGNLMLQLKKRMLALRYYSQSVCKIKLKI